MAYGYQEPGWGGSPLLRLIAMPPVTAALIKANVAVFAATLLLSLFRMGGILDFLALSRYGFLHGGIWQPLTYMFLHSGLFHILVNMLMLLFMGPEVERETGGKHFLAMYLLAGVLGGIGWMLLAPYDRTTCVGASGAVFGVLAAYGTLFPMRRLTVFLFFFFPVSMLAWQLAAGLAFVQLLYLTGGSQQNIAYAAHVFGALAGYLYVRVLRGQALIPLGGEGRRRNGGVSGWFAKVRQKTADFANGWQNPFRRRGPSGGTGADDGPVDQAEVDRILDKITREGIQSLTDAERATLRKASSRTV
jgi:membrane associated rhomboid family serine protease